MRPGSRDGSLTRWLTVLVVGAMLNMGLAYRGAARATGHSAGPRADFEDGRGVETPEEGAPVTYGLDPDKVPFALRDDGVKARYLSLSPGNLKVQLTKDSALGEVEFRRKSRKETLTTFTPASGDPLVIRTVVSPKNAGKQVPDFDMVFQSNKRKAVVGVEQGRVPAAPATRGSERQLREVLSAAGANPTMSSLTREAAFFLSKPVMGGLLRRAFQYDLEACIKVDPFECTKETIYCLGAIGGYVVGVGGLLSACAVTVGATCIGALLAHPILGAVVVFQCNSAVVACGYGSGDKKPCPKTLGGDFGLILQ